MNLDGILHPIIVVFAWIWVKIHDVVQLVGLPLGAGAGWVVSIVILTLLVRFLILPLYIKQIKSQRGMQVLQPELQKITAKYKGKKDQVSRQKQSEETMALYKKNGTSPFSSCLPLAVQMPIILALYRVILAVQQLSTGNYMSDRLGPLTKDVAVEISSSTVMNVGMFDSLKTTPGMLKGAFVVLIVLMVGFQFFSMWLGMKRNMPPAQDPNNPMVRSQKMMLYMMPAMFAFSGFIFQMAMLVYMVTTAMFSWAQQVWVIKVMPTPGAPAYIDLTAKRQKKYQDWAKPYFADFPAKKKALEGNEEEIDKFSQQVLADAAPYAKRAKVFSKFPEDMSAVDKASLYYQLSVDDWEILPDENWFKGIMRARRPQEDKQSRQAKQPKKLSRAQRMRRDELTRQEAEVEAKAAERALRKETQKQKRSRVDLSPEEVERRRQERRAAQRAHNRSKKKNQ